MVDNHLYNLMLQMVQENKSLWRIDKHYKEDASSCKKCTKFWEEMEEDKKQHVEDLMELIKEHH
ncbi:MAG: hypothetical protein R3346_01940 [Candidatus Spechtbacterales bacterium]|nr:hypothetical protein [Candidatus Spechtbacterales bacterium]